MHTDTATCTLTPHPPSTPAGYVLTDLVRNQLADTAKARGISEEEVINKVLLADQPTKQFVKPEDVAALVLHLCGPHSSSFTGACLSIDGGWTAR
jgi:3-hydroxybutyrate dehydrogenase